MTPATRTRLRKEFRYVLDGDHDEIALWVRANADALDAILAEPEGFRCICEIDRHDFGCPVHNAGEPPHDES